MIPQRASCTGWSCVRHVGSGVGETSIIITTTSVSSGAILKCGGVEWSSRNWGFELTIFNARAYLR